MKHINGINIPIIGGLVIIVTAYVTRLDHPPGIFGLVVGAVSLTIYRAGQANRDDQ